MNEIKGNLWEQSVYSDFACITTNGYVTKNGEAVMGRGCALEASKKFAEIKKILGELLTRHGNHCFILPYHWAPTGYSEDYTFTLVSFPVKEFWKEKARPELIRRSCQELMKMIPTQAAILLPRPGCGNGQLDWQTEVKPICEKELDDRVTIISK